MTIASGIEALEKAVAGRPKVNFRKGNGQEARKHGVRYIPYLVAVDGDGNALKTFDARALQSAHKAGNLPDTVLEAVGR